jgi:heme/copper-type cytochrome/quinol oxidase subunit 3
MPCPYAPAIFHRETIRLMVPTTSISAEEKRRLRAEREAAVRLKNNKLGISIFQGSWIMVFVALIVVYWQLGFNEGWRPTADQKPGFLLPALATASLLLSTYLARSALQVLKADQVSAFQTRWLGAIGTGALFLLIMMQQFFAFVQADGSNYVSIYRVMIGYHALHALIIGLMMIQVYRFSQFKRYHAGNTWTVEAAARLWYFVTVAWLMFYVVLYLI